MDIPHAGQRRRSRRPSSTSSPGGKRRTRPRHRGSGQIRSWCHTRCSPAHDPAPLPRPPGRLSSLTRTHGRWPGRGRVARSAQLVPSSPPERRPKQRGGQTDLSRGRRAAARRRRGRSPSPVRAATPNGAVGRATRAAARPTDQQGRLMYELVQWRPRTQDSGGTADAIPPLCCLDRRAPEGIRTPNLLIRSYVPTVCMPGLGGQE
jgi:hypothetical protein